MKLGIAGCGMIVHALLKMIHEVEGIELEAIASVPNEYEKVKKLAEENNISKAYVSFEKMLNDKDIDVVYLGVPNFLHYPMTKQALLSNKNVICEKPFTSNYKEAKELASIANERKLMIFEAVTTRYLPNTLKIKELLPKLGNIKIVSINYSQYSSRYDLFKSGEILPAFDCNKSGGALMDLNIYNINFIVTLFGKPQSVHYQANIERGIDTSGVLTLDYGSFKAVCVGAKDCMAPVISSIQGDKGCIVIDSPVNKLAEFKVLMNKEGSKQMTNNDTEYVNYNGDYHKMYHEFKKIVEVYNNKDFDFMNEMLNISLQTMEIQTKAREDAGIVFAADK